MRDDQNTLGSTKELKKENSILIISYIAPLEITSRGPNKIKHCKTS